MSRQARRRSLILKEQPERRWSWLFRATGYFCERGMLRVGRKSAWLDCWLAEAGEQHWVWVTADNPGAVLDGAERNAAAQSVLLARLARWGLNVMPMSAVADAGDWPVEYGYLCCGVGVSKARRIGREFGQLAVLAGTRKGRVRIIWLAGS